MTERSLYSQVRKRDANAATTAAAAMASTGFQNTQHQFIKERNFSPTTTSNFGGYIAQIDQGMQQSQYKQPANLLDNADNPFFQMDVRNFDQHHNQGMNITGSAQKEALKIPNINPNRNHFESKKSSRSKSGQKVSKGGIGSIQNSVMSNSINGNNLSVSGNNPQMIKPHQQSDAAKIILNEYLNQHSELLQSINNTNNLQKLSHYIRDGVKSSTGYHRNRRDENNISSRLNYTNDLSATQNTNNLSNTINNKNYDQNSMLSSANRRTPFQPNDTLGIDQTNLNNPNYLNNNPTNNNGSTNQSSQSKKYMNSGSFFTRKNYQTNNFIQPNETNSNNTNQLPSTQIRRGDMGNTQDDNNIQQNPIGLSSTVGMPIKNSSKNANGTNLSQNKSVKLRSFTPNLRSYKTSGQGQFDQSLTHRGNIGSNERGKDEFDTKMLPHFKSNTNSRENLSSSKYKFNQMVSANKAMNQMNNNNNNNNNLNSNGSYLSSVPLNSQPNQQYLTTDAMSTQQDVFRTENDIYTAPSNDNQNYYIMNTNPDKMPNTSRNKKSNSLHLNAQNIISTSAKKLKDENKGDSSSQSSLNNNSNINNNNPNKNINSPTSDSNGNLNGRPKSKQQSQRPTLKQRQDEKMDQIKQIYLKNDKRSKSNGRGSKLHDIPESNYNQSGHYLTDSQKSIPKQRNNNPFYVQQMSQQHEEYGDEVEEIDVSEMFKKQSKLQQMDSAPQNNNIQLQFKQIQDKNTSKSNKRYLNKDQEDNEMDKKQQKSNVPAKGSQLSTTQNDELGTNGLSVNGCSLNSMMNSDNNKTSQKTRDDINDSFQSSKRNNESAQQDKNQSQQIKNNSIYAKVIQKITQNSSGKILNPSKISNYQGEIPVNNNDVFQSDFSDCRNGQIQNNNNNSNNNNSSSFHNRSASALGRQKSGKDDPSANQNNNQQKQQENNQNIKNEQRNSQIIKTQDWGRSSISANPSEQNLKRSNEIENQSGKTMSQQRSNSKSQIRKRTISLNQNSVSAKKQIQNQNSGDINNNTNQNSKEGQDNGLNQSNKQHSAPSNQNKSLSNSSKQKDSNQLKLEKQNDEENKNESVSTTNKSKVNQNQKGQKQENINNNNIEDNDEIVGKQKLQLRDRDQNNQTEQQQRDKKKTNGTQNSSQNNESINEKLPQQGNANLSNLQQKQKNEQQEDIQTNNPNQTKIQNKDKKDNSNEINGQSKPPLKLGSGHQKNQNSNTSQKQQSENDQTQPIDKLKTNSNNHTIDKTNSDNSLKQDQQGSSSSNNNLQKLGDKITLSQIKQDKSIVIESDQTGQHKESIEDNLINQQNQNKHNKDKDQNSIINQKESQQNNSQQLNSKNKEIQQPNQDNVTKTNLILSDNKGKNLNNCDIQNVSKQTNQQKSDDQQEHIIKDNNINQSQNSNNSINESQNQNNKISGISNKSTKENIVKSQIAQQQQQQLQKVSAEIKDIIKNNSNLNNNLSEKANDKEQILNQSSSTQKQLNYISSSKDNIQNQKVSDKMNDSQKKSQNISNDNQNSIKNDSKANQEQLTSNQNKDIKSKKSNSSDINQIQNISYNKSDQKLQNDKSELKSQQDQLNQSNQRNEQDLKSSQNNNNSHENEINKQQSQISNKDSKQQSQSKINNSNDGTVSLKDKQNSELMDQKQKQGNSQLQSSSQNANQIDQISKIINQTDGKVDGVVIREFREQNGNELRIITEARIIIQNDNQNGGGRKKKQKEEGGENDDEDDSESSNDQQNDGDQSKSHKKKKKQKENNKNPQSNKKNAKGNKNDNINDEDSDDEAQITEDQQDGKSKIKKKRMKSQDEKQFLEDKINLTNNQTQGQTKGQSSKKMSEQKINNDLSRIDNEFKTIPKGDISGVNTPNRNQQAADISNFIKAQDTSNILLNEEIQREPQDQTNDDSIADQNSILAQLKSNQGSLKNLNPLNQPAQQQNDNTINLNYQEELLKDIDNEDKEKKDAKDNQDANQLQHKLPNNEHLQPKNNDNQEYLSKNDSSNYKGNNNPSSSQGSHGANKKFNKYKEILNKNLVQVQRYPIKETEGEESLQSLHHDTSDELEQIIKVKILHDQQTKNSHSSYESLRKNKQIRPEAKSLEFEEIEKLKNENNLTPEEILDLHIEQNRRKIRKINRRPHIVKQDMDKLIENAIIFDIKCRLPKNIDIIEEIRTDPRSGELAFGRESYLLDSQPKVRYFRGYDQEMMRPCALVQYAIDQFCDPQTVKEWHLMQHFQYNAQIEENRFLNLQMNTQKDNNNTEGEGNSAKKKSHYGCHAEVSTSHNVFMNPTLLLMDSPLVYEYRHFEYTFFLQIEDFYPIDMILLNRFKDRKIYEENELLFIFASLIECILGFRSKNICLSNIQVEHVVFCPASNSYKFFDLTKAQVFEEQNLEKRYNVYTSRIYQAPEIVEFGSTTDVGQQFNLFAAELYALGIVLLCFKYHMISNNRTQNFVQNRIEMCKNSMQLSGLVINYLLDEDPKQRIQNMHIVQRDLYQHMQTLYVNNQQTQFKSEIYSPPPNTSPQNKSRNQELNDDNNNLIGKKLHPDDFKEKIIAVNAPQRKQNNYNEENEENKRDTLDEFQNNSSIISAAWNASNNKSFMKRVDAPDYEHEMNWNEGKSVNNKQLNPPSSKKITKQIHERIQAAQDIARMYKYTFQWEKASNQYINNLEIMKSQGNKISDSEILRTVNQIWQSLYYNNELDDSLHYNEVYFNNIHTLYMHDEVQMAYDHLLSGKLKWILNHKVDSSQDFDISLMCTEQFPLDKAKILILLGDFFAEDSEISAEQYYKDALEILQAIILNPKEILSSSQSHPLKQQRIFGGRENTMTAQTTENDDDQDDIFEREEYVVLKLKEKTMHQLAVIEDIQMSELREKLLFLEENSQKLSSVEKAKIQLDVANQYCHQFLKYNEAEYYYEEALKNLNIKSVSKQNQQSESDQKKAQSSQKMVTSSSREKRMKKVTPKELEKDSQQPNLKSSSSSSLSSSSSNNTQSKKELAYDIQKFRIINYLKMNNEEEAKQKIAQIVSDNTPENGIKNIDNILQLAIILEENLFHEYCLELYNRCYALAIVQLGAKNEFTIKLNDKINKL